MALMNRNLAPKIETVFLVRPRSDLRQLRSCAKSRVSAATYRRSSIPRCRSPQAASFGKYVSGPASTSGRGSQGSHRARGREDARVQEAVRGSSAKVWEWSGCSSDADPDAPRTMIALLRSRLLTNPPTRCQPGTRASADFGACLVGLAGRRSCSAARCTERRDDRLRSSAVGTAPDIATVSGAFYMIKDDRCSRSPMPR